MTALETEEYQIKVCDLAEQILDNEIAKGKVFSEALSNWALNEAEKQINLK